MATKSILTLRLNEEQQGNVARLQALTGQATASKAILTAVRRYPDERWRAHDLENQVTALQEQLDETQGDLVAAQARLAAVRQALDEPAGALSGAGGTAILPA